MFVRSLNMQNSIVVTAQEYVDKLKTEYLEKHTKMQERDELIAENNIEKRDIKGYHGREILELLQNADDAYQKSIELGQKPNCDLIVSIRYINNVLTVTNTGTYFDKDGIKAIVQGNNSPKTGKYIGNKGTGFRSVLNWANAVRIFSGEYNIEFSKEIASKHFKEIKNSPQIQKQLSRFPHLYLPMLAVPTNIDNKFNYNTTVEIEIDPKKQDDDYSVSKQLENIDLRILLFLPNISQIEITTESNSVVYKREIVSNKITTVLLQKIVDNKIEIEENFYLFNKRIPAAIKEDDMMKDIVLSIAVPQNFNEFKNDYLYSFFPLLDTTSPFNCVLHASYSLGDHRNSITQNKENKEIIKHQIKFLIEVATYFAETNQHEIAYKILIPSNFNNYNWKFTVPYSNFVLEDFYLDMLSKQKIFVSVNNENISIADGIKVISGEYPKVFSGQEFQELLSYVDDDTLDLIECLAARKDIDIDYKEDDILHKINNITNLWSISQQVEVFEWWNRNYGSSLPNLLKKQNNEWLNYKEECFFLIGGFEEKGLPSWVKIPALNKAYQQELFRVTESTKKFIELKESVDETKTERIICQNNLYKTVSFKYRDINSIISAVNSSVNTYNKAVDFIKWLWSNYGEKDGWNPPGQSDNSTLKYNFPSHNDRCVKNSENLYFGSNYNNNLAEKLFDESYGNFPPISDFNVNESYYEKFVEFIKKFGVKDFPAIEIQSISNPITAYKNECLYEIKTTCELGSSTSFICKYSLPYINNLEEILLSLSTVEILKWISADSTLYACLSTPYTSNADISYCGNLQQYFRKYNGKIKNYILEVFNNTSWVGIDGARYSPKQVLQNFKSKNNQKFCELVPTLNTETIVEFSKEINSNFEEIYNIFQMFNFADKVTDLSSNEFYGLLLKLPSHNFVKSIEISKHIYRIVEQSYFTKKFEYSENKRKFFSEGKVLANYQGQLQYFLAQEVFLPSTRIINKKDYKIIVKGARTNNENFERVFGCKEYVSNYTIINGTIVVSDANNKFQNYYTDFHKYARAYSERNDNIEKYSRALNVTLVKEIKILDNGIETIVDEEYTCIRDTTTNWYITVYGNEFDLNILSEIIENIYSNIANTPGFESSKIGELFRAKDKETREFLIRKEFGSFEVIDDSYYKNEIKTLFIKTICQIAPNYNIDNINIDFDEFSNIKNIPVIRSVLNDINTDVEEFKNRGFVYIIDLIPYYRKKVTDFIFNEKEKFKDVLFKYAKTDENKKKSFLKTIHKFENFGLFIEYENTINFDYEKIIVDEFGDWRNEDANSADKEYAKNYQLLNPEKLFEDELANDMNIKTMIYFNMEKEFKAWLDEKKKQNIKENNHIKQDEYLKQRTTIPILSDISYTTCSSLQKGHIDSQSTHHGVYTRTEAEHRQKRQKLQGNKGELLAYNYLCQKYGEENVTARSEAFVDMNLLVAGQAVSGDYDISYKDHQGNVHFVEVKTSNQNSFIISPNELEFAKSHDDQYELFLVFDVDSENPELKILPKRFWNDSKFRRNDIIERIEFTF